VSEPEFADTCRVCGDVIGWIDCPTGGWWKHTNHPADDHDAVPVGDENGCYTLPDGDCVGVCTIHRPL
jgi:hypothetical protein